jgi:hypothetical protein
LPDLNIKLLASPGVTLTYFSIALGFKVVLCFFGIVSIFCFDRVKFDLLTHSQDNFIIIESFEHNFPISRIHSNIDKKGHNKIFLQFLRFFKPFAT